MKLAALGLVVMLAVLPAAWADHDYSQGVNSRQVEADEMVQNILQWLQGVYRNNNRKIRQNLSYLPPAGQNAERPRPFRPPAQKPYKPPTVTYEPSTEGPTDAPYQPSGAPFSPSGPSSSEPNSLSSQQYPDYSNSGYPLPGPSPQPPFISPNPGYEYTKPNENPASTNIPYQPSTPGYKPTDQPNYPSSTSSPDEFYETNEPSYKPIQTEPPATYRPIPTNPPQTFRPIPTNPPPTYRPNPTNPPQTFRPNPTNPPPTYRPNPTNPPPTYRPNPTNPPPNPTYEPTTPDYKPPSSTYQPETGENEDDKHPPHIHAIDVQCAKDMMTINLEFNKVYNGIIYSKGFFSNPNCRYVQENSNQVKYTFTLSLNSCGTEFINGFDTQGQSYLENVLVLQNEVGFQEVWDSIRSVRCLWEGNINKQLSVALSVGMLNQEIVTFSGDTAMASLDIQVGRGPFAPPANGLVKIGETMTLVISITGDPAFDIQVKDCVARDADSENIVRLTDDDGCILKPKIFGAFQKTRETENTGASILAYAFFSAFKFPDAMDLILECNVELCKNNCDMCSEPNQKLEPGRRRRRDTYAGNETLADPIRVGKGLKVIIPEDISFSEPLGICLSYTGFLWGSAFILFALVISCITAGFMWLKLQKHSQCKNHM